MENISTVIALNNDPDEYIIVTEEASYADSYSAYRNLEKEVNNKLKEGWKLCGGVSIGNIGEDYFCICQAMTKVQKNNK